MENTNNRLFDSIYYSSVTWKIYNYLSRPLEVNNPILTPEFVTNLNDPIKWTLAMTGRRRIGRKYVTEVSLRRSASCNGPLVINVNSRIAMALMDDKIWSKHINNEPLAVNDEILLRMSGIFENIDDYCEDKLGDFAIITVTCDLHTRASIQLSIDVDLQYLSTHIYNFLMSGKHGNLCLKLGTDAYTLHGPIVKARSPYIAGVLSKDPSLREVDLTKMCSNNQLKGLIRYWYSGDLEKLLTTNTKSTFNFVHNMKQLGLIRYSPPETIVLATTIKTKTKYITWVIDDPQFCEKLKHLEIPIYNPYTCVKDSWTLCFYPKETIDDKNYICLEIEEAGESSFPSPVYLEVYLTDESGAEYGCKSAHSLLRDPGPYEFPEFMEHDEFRKIQRTLLENNKLRIGCRITHGTGEVKHQISLISDQDISVLTEVNPYKTLANDLKNLLESGDMSDISLKTGDSIFRVHKSILAARSVYFNDLFSEPEFKIPKSGNIHLEDINPDDLYRILKYMYCAEKFELNETMVMLLYPVVCKFKIFRLKRVFCTYLQNILQKNALEIMELADNVNDGYLRTIVSKYILENDEFYMYFHISRNYSKGLESDILYWPYF